MIMIEIMENPRTPDAREDHSSHPPHSESEAIGEIWILWFLDDFSQKIWILKKTIDSNT